MIASIEGIVTQVLDDSLVILVNGIGIKVFVPADLSTKAELHKNIGLFTHLVVREESLTLFGFETAEARDMYVLLLGVSGVGPKTSLGIVSALSLEMIQRAVIMEEPDLLSRVPGIGKKTAQSIVLNLHGKISADHLGTGTRVSDSDADVISGLTGLGYSLVEAQAALQMIPKDAPDDLEERIRLALKYFS